MTSTLPLPCFLSTELAEEFREFADDAGCTLDEVRQWYAESDDKSSIVAYVRRRNREWREYRAMIAEERRAG